MPQAILLRYCQDIVREKAHKRVALLCYPLPLPGGGDGELHGRCICVLSRTRVPQAILLRYCQGVIDRERAHRRAREFSVPADARRLKKNPPLTNNSQGRIDISIRGATLIRTCVRACKIPSYLRQLTRSSRRAILGKRLSFAPSAGHLTTCVLFDSHPSELSVNARSPLLPLQRFIP